MFKNLSPSALGISAHQSEMIELALTYGFGGIDLDMVELVGRVKLHGMPYARRLIDSAKIKVGTFSLPVNWEASDEVFQAGLKALPEVASAAAEIGCTRCVATLSSAGDELPYHENFEFHKGRFIQICEALEPSGVRLGLGFRAAEYLRKGKEFQFIHDLDSLTLLVNMVGAANLGLLLDIWEMVIGGGSVESIGSLSGDQIVAVQVAQVLQDVAPADLDDTSRLLPDVEDGRIDISAALSSLKEIGFDGPVTIKPSRGIFRTRRREMIAKQTGEALDKVWRAAGLPSNSRQSATVPSAPEAPAETKAPAEG